MRGHMTHWNHLRFGANLLCPRGETGRRAKVDFV